MLIRSLLAVLLTALSPLALAEVPKQPRAPGIESSDYVWNEPKGEKLEILKLKGDVQRGKVAYEVCQGCHKPTGAGISDVVLYTISLAHDVLVVTTPEPTAMTDAYATIKVLATTQSRRSMQLVVNQVLKTGEGRMIRAQLQQVIDRYVSPAVGAPVTLDLLGDVPVDPTVREAVQRRELLLELYPGAPAARAVVALAARITQ